MSAAIGELDQRLAATTNVPIPAHLRPPVNPGFTGRNYYSDDEPSGLNSKNSSSVVVEGIPLSELHTIASRTPSPTPSEAALLRRESVFDRERMKDWRFWIRKEWAWRYVILAIIIAITILIVVEKDNIVRWIEPVAKKLRNIPANWLIPIAILFVISFPPLFGHELIALICGAVYGLWVGFAVTAAGTFLGEIGNYYAFKYLCRARGEKLEKTNLQYACFARLVRTGGFKVALITRYSAIPGHFSTAAFSTCGIGIISFSLAALLSLPKQLALVYVGVVFEDSGNGTETRSEKTISVIIIVVTSIVTLIALRYILYQMAKVKDDVVYERRKARQEKLERASGSQTRLVVAPIGIEDESSIGQSVHAPRPLYAPASNVANV
ncbi:hypothetical protein M0805_008428 [Coniferiporia weirii]|nr:hypothetical protein M0805_008428 [Coniferiporia weirii]